VDYYCGPFLVNCVWCGFCLWDVNRPICTFLRIPRLSTRWMMMRIRPLAFRPCQRAHQLYVPRSKAGGLLNSRCYSTVPPPTPTETTSRSSGLEHQLHPSGRPPINPIQRNLAPTDTQNFSPESAAQSVYATGGYRTPLRTAATNVPVSTRDSIKVVYKGSLGQTVRGLKAFSISSLMFSAGMAPVILLMEADLPMAARISLVAVSNTPGIK
jgi:hypothetical protein